MTGSAARSETTAPDSWTAAPRHEEIFLRRYQALRRWALRLMGGDASEADDLVHEAFLQFVRRGRDLSEIHNVDAYLYGLLRRLRLVKGRSRRREDSLGDLDDRASALVLRGSDARATLQARDELRVICEYACRRKETSKTGGVLLLRFFHGFFPREIARILNAPLRGANDWLRIARREARAYLDEPATLSIGREARRTPADAGDRDRDRVDDPLDELRRAIQASRRGPCYDVDALAGFYRADPPETMTCEMLAHVVSCAACLDRLTKALGMRPPAERDPHDMLGQDVSRWSSPRASRVGLLAALLAVGAISAALLWRSGPVSAAELLGTMRTREAAALATPHVVLHRVVTVEQRLLPQRTLRTMRRVEQWRAPGGQITARRVYDERNQLVAGEWRVAHGARTLYQPGEAPDVHPSAESPSLRADAMWQWEPSARDFGTLTDGSDAATLIERDDRYLLTWRRAIPDGDDGLIEATLLVERPSLRAIEQTLLVREGGVVSEFRFRESARTDVPAGEVPRGAFEPEPELTGPRAEPSAAEPPRLPDPAPPTTAQAPTHEQPVDDESELDALLARHREGRCLEDAVAPTAAARLEGPGGAAHRWLVDRLARAGVAAADGSADTAARAVTMWAAARAGQVVAEGRFLAALTARWPAERLERLDVDRVARWQDVVRDHARGVRRDTRALRLQLMAFFPEWADEGEEGPPAVQVRALADIDPGVAELAFRAAAQRDAFAALFSVPADVPSDALDFARIVSAFRATEGQASWFDEPWEVTSTR